MILEITMVLLLIGANGVLALAEIAMVSANRGRLENDAKDGQTGASAALELAENETAFLSTVQVGITLVGILTGAFGGATIARQLSPALEPLPVVGPYASTVSVGLVVVITTYLTLVFGELVPKRIALSGPERWASALAPIMQTLSVITTPAVRLLSVSTDAVLRVFGIPLQSEDEVTEEDLMFLIRRGAREGVLLPQEEAMLDRVLSLDDRRVGTLMTPHPDLVWLDPSDPVEENVQKIVTSGHDYYPVGDGDLDHLVGMLSTQTLLRKVMNGQEVNLRRDSMPPLLIPEGTRALRALDLFKQSGTKAALIVDEYGAIQGMVTLADYMAELVGDDAPLYATQEPLIIRRDDGSLLIDGVLPVEELAEAVEGLEIPAEADRSYQTLGGFIMEKMGRIPTSGDHFEQQGFRFEVMDMDARRVDKVLVTRIKEKRQQ